MDFFCLLPRSRLGRCGDGVNKRVSREHCGLVRWRKRWPFALQHRLDEAAEGPDLFY